MAELNQNVTILLDRLYNLKGEDNVLIKETEEKIDAVLARISNIESTIAETETAQEQQEKSLSVFLQQKSLFETAFEGLTDETFSALRNIDVNLEMGTFLSRVQEKSPEFIKNLTDTIEGIKRAIIGYNSELEIAKQELTGLREQLVIHNEQRAQLVSLLEQSLSTQEIERESLTTSFVKRILTTFGIFTIDEISKLTKIIIFPEDGLFEYDKKYEERLSKGLIGFVEDETKLEEHISNGDNPSSEVSEDEVTSVFPISEDHEDFSLEESREDVSQSDNLEETQLDSGIISGSSEDKEFTEEAVSTVEPTSSVIIDEPTTYEEPANEKMFEGPPVVLNFQQMEETDLEKATITPDEQQIEDTFDDTRVKALLEKLGLDINNFEKFNSESLTTILKEIASVEEELVERNYEILRSINLDEEAYKMRFRHMYLTDIDFNKKITLLRAKNISEQKICSMIKNTNSGLRVPFIDMEKRIQAVENLQGKIDEENIYMICKDVSKYEENIETLLKYGIDIDNKESRNYSAILFESLNIPSNVEILKNYVISILRSNGKYALSVFWKKPEELLADIDDLIEAGLENVIATHPEILGMTASSIIRRVKWCEENGQPVFNDDIHSEPCEYIIRGERFRTIFDYPKNLPALVDKKQNNDSLIEGIGNSDYIEILLNTLDDYYRKNDSYNAPEVIDIMKDRFEELSHYLEDHAKAELIGKYTYKINGVCICKNKLERNIAIILNTLAAANQPTLGVEKEIVLVSALYNSRLTEEELQKVVGSCLGFNQAAQEVKL